MTHQNCSLLSRKIIGKVLTGNINFAFLENLAYAFFNILLKEDLLSRMSYTDNAYLP